MFADYEFFPSASVDLPAKGTKSAKNYSTNFHRFAVSLGFFPKIALMYADYEFFPSASADLPTKGAKSVKNYSTNFLRFAVSLGFFPADRSDLRRLTCPCLLA